uniref:NADH dehydrogenase subunit 3 n=1 Tax=Parascaris univalens TaxID=6257 RepID=A0A915CI26_PARUN
MSWTPFLIIFIVLACILIIAIIVVAVVYFRIDQKRSRMLKENYPPPRQV